ncbi:hypothetical protein PR048_018373 [Dryococelus australis]|uniref:Uncharacterized protein n=1 Tax=Dryococelus australis TaxID=614101 RepID=A0ABQ9HCA6_9NEOP|nr:hypothetical protein PR048_018373 [Dryococelus australis]
MLSVLQSQKIPFHLCTLPEYCNAHVVIRNLDIDTPISDISESLTEHNIRDTKLLHMESKCEFPEPSPLFLVMLEGTYQLQQAIKLTNLNGMAIKVELVCGAGKGAQCFRSQGCSENIRCDHFGGPYMSTQCDWPKDAHLLAVYVKQKLDICKTLQKLKSVFQSFKTIESLADKCEILIFGISTIFGVCDSFTQPNTSNLNPL